MAVCFAVSRPLSIHVGTPMKYEDASFATWFVLQQQEALAVEVHYVSCSIRIHAVHAPDGLAV